MKCQIRNGPFSATITVLRLHSKVIVVLFNNHPNCMFSYAVILYLHGNCREVLQLKEECATILPNCRSIFTVHIISWLGCEDRIYPIHGQKS